MTSGRSVRGAPVLFVGLGYAFVMLIVGTNLATPLYAGYAARFGFSPAVITLLGTSYAFAVAAALLVCGPLADAFGYRSVLMPAYLLAGLGCLLFVAASGTGWLFAGRVVQGLAVGAASGALTAGLVMTEPAGDVRRASLVGSVTPTLGSGLGPVLAGGLAQYAPSPFTLCFLVELLLLVPAFAAVAALPRGGMQPGATWPPRRPHVPRAIRAPFAVASAVSVLAWAVAYVVLTLVPSYVATTLHSGNLLLAGGAAGVLLLCAAAAQVGCFRWPPRRSMPAGLVGLLAGLVGLIAAGRLGSTPLLLGAVALAGCGQGLAFLGGVRVVNQIAPSSDHAGVVSAFYVVTYLGAGIPVIGVGVLANVLSLVSAVELFAAGAAVGCVATLGWARRVAAGG